MTTRIISDEQKEEFIFRINFGRFFLCILATTFVSCLHGVNPERNTFGKQTVDPNKICITQGCNDTVNIFENNMDESVNPCENFYQFACGKFNKETVIPLQQSEINIFTITQKKINNQLKSALEGIIEHNEPQSFKVMQQYYNVCMNTSETEETSETFFKKILRSVGGWPILEGESWNESKFDWKKTVYKLKKVGYSGAYFTHFKIDADIKNSKLLKIYIDQPKMIIDQERLSQGWKNQIVQAYFKYMVEFTVLLGADRKQAEKELSESLNFEIELAKISLPIYQRTERRYIFTKLTIRALSFKYPGIPWLEYINRMLKAYPRLRSTDEIFAGPRIFLKNIGALISKTPKRVLANYIMWNVAFDSADKLSSRVEHISHKFYSSILGTSIIPERWEICLEQVRNTMPLALGSLYVRRFFDESSKTGVGLLLKNIRKTLQDILSQADWMDNRTKKVALEKLQAMNHLIAYPRELLCNKKLDDYYADMDINPKSYLATQLSMNVSVPLNTDQILETSFHEIDWYTQSYVADVNAFHEHSQNSIILPAGVLQGLFYSEDRPKYLNYAGLGALIAHEIMHGFDVNGANYDKHGNLCQWWERRTRRTFDRRAQCIYDQYNNVTVKEVDRKINGKLTLAENVADNAGYKIAYLSYLEGLKLGGPEPGLPDLPYRGRQLFWIAAANVWCTKMTREQMENQLLMDRHSPSEQRVNIAFSNRPEFAADFNCTAGSPMNPVDKCSVW